MRWHQRWTNLFTLLASWLCINIIIFSSFEFNSSNFFARKQHIEYNKRLSVLDMLSKVGYATMRESLRTEAYISFLVYSGANWNTKMGWNKQLQGQLWPSLLYGVWEYHVDRLGYASDRQNILKLASVRAKSQGNGKICRSWSQGLYLLRVRQMRKSISQ